MSNSPAIAEWIHCMLFAHDQSWQGHGWTRGWICDCSAVLVTVCWRFGDAVLMMGVTSKYSTHCKPHRPAPRVMMRHGNPHNSAAWAMLGFVERKKIGHKFRAGIFHHNRTLLYHIVMYIPDPDDLIYVV